MRGPDSLSGSHSDGPGIYRGIGTYFRIVQGSGMEGPVYFEAHGTQ